ncbi:cuticle protein-like [Periplaneta americana]|uniref:cuticle protein-like n=1 Tax=Periplaneta americana TaxID=6978 RepID=UPI0037E7E2E3
MVIKLLLVAFTVCLVRGGYTGVPTLPLAVAPAVRVEPYDPNPQYSYAYSIHDALTGDSKGQQETRSGDVVQGSYSLVEPDGTIRTVEYFADPVNGFNAVVHREPAVFAAPVARVAAPLGVTSPVAKVATPVGVATPITVVDDTVNIAAPVARVATPIVNSPVARVATPIVNSPVARVATPIVNSPVARVATPVGVATPVARLDTNVDDDTVEVGAPVPSPVSDGTSVVRPDTVVTPIPVAPVAGVVTSPVVPGVTYAATPFARSFLQPELPSYDPYGYNVKRFTMSFSTPTFSYSY